MKDIFNGIIVVEGKTDVSVLSSFLDAEYVITNGSAIDNDVLNYLLSRSKNTQIVVLTDPDMPGKRIRDIIEAKIPNVSHCFIEKKYAIKKNKVGVAECDINYLKDIYTIYKNLIDLKSKGKSITFDNMNLLTN